MRRLVLYIILLVLAVPMAAQQMQWASEVVDKSSQYGPQHYSAQQALGVPNAINGRTTEMMAWAPAREDASLGEFIHVRYTVAMRIQQVVVVESKNAGAISRITLYDENNKRHIIYQNQSPKGEGQTRIFSHTFPLTSYNVKEVSVELKTSAVSGSNHIDAIGISASANPYQRSIKNELTQTKGISAAEDLGIQINSAFAERLPIISPDGKTLWFARKYHPQNRGDDDNDDIWVSNLQGGNTWSRPINIGPPLNDDRHNFVFAVSPAGNKIWLANEYASSKKDGISYSSKYGRTWSRPKNVRINDHYNDSPFVCYHMSTDEKVLLMSVERREGLGNNDLYFARRTDNGEYSKPISLGSSINTVGDESSVFLAADGKTIYFSSNGHEGYGGYDMYRSQRLDDTWQRWSEPINLGKNINSPDNDYNYTIPAKGDYAYFSRDDASGMSDLFRIKLPEDIQPEPVVFITGQLLDANTKQALGGVLKYKKENEAANKMVSDNRGKFSVILPYGENVEIYAEKKGYYPISEQIHLAEMIEELDSDGGQETESQATIHNPEIDQLQLRLKELEEDLTVLEKPSTTKQQTRPKGENITRPYASDRRLMDLQKRYENQANAQQKGQTKTIPQTKNELNTKSVEEDELAAMKRKFNEQNGIKTPNTNTQERTRRPVTSNENNQTDDELSAMKRKFNQYNGKAEDGDFGDRNTGVDYVNWEVVEQITRREVEDELIPKVRKDLEKELLSETKSELAQTLKPNELKALQGVKPRLAMSEYKGIRGGTATDQIPDWAGEIKEELRKALEDEVRRELRIELRAEVKEELRRELEFQVKKELEGELRKELEAKIRAELLAEQNRPSTQIPQRKTAPLNTPEVSVDLPDLVYKEVKKEVLLAPIKVGQIIPMNNIFFDSNEASLKNESFSELERVTAFLKENSHLIIEIGGHTNGWCSHIFANELSAERAERVREYLINEGISGDKIQFHGYGKTQPIASNDTKAGRRKNQRVEMKILAVE